MYIRRFLFFFAWSLLPSPLADRVFDSTGLARLLACLNLTLSFRSHCINLRMAQQMTIRPSQLHVEYNRVMSWSRFSSTVHWTYRLNAGMYDLPQKEYFPRFSSAVDELTLHRRYRAICKIVRWIMIHEWDSHRGTYKRWIEAQYEEDQNPSTRIWHPSCGQWHCFNRLWQIGKAPNELSRLRIRARQ